MNLLSRHLILLILALVSFAGCQEVVDPAVLKEREKYLLSEEPPGAIGVAQARKQMTDQQQPIVLLGRVGAGEHSTWEPGKAAFVVRDPAAPLHQADSAGHDPATCPFCNGEQGSPTDMTAAIRVVDDSGAVVQIDARELLPIREEQLVVVEGTAQVDQLGRLVIAATGVYVRR